MAYKLSLFKIFYHLEENLYLIGILMAIFKHYQPKITIYIQYNVLTITYFLEYNDISGLSDGRDEKKSNR
jgi:hypothetical protein